MDVVYYIRDPSDRFLAEAKKLISLRFLSKAVYSHDPQAGQTCSLAQLFVKLRALAEPIDTLFIYAHGNETGQLYMPLNESLPVHSPETQVECINLTLLWEEVAAYLGTCDTHKYGNQPAYLELLVPRDSDGALLVRNVSIRACLIGESLPMLSVMKAIIGSGVVSITDSGFNPRSLALPNQSYVIWRNDDVVDHAVEAEDGSFTSGAIKPGGTFKQQFEFKNGEDEVAYFLTEQNAIRGQIRRTEFYLTAPRHMLYILSYDVGTFEILCYNFRVRANKKLTRMELIEKLKARNLQFFFGKPVTDPLGKNIGWVPQKIESTQYFDYSALLGREFGPFKKNHLFKSHYDSAKSPPEPVVGIRQYVYTPESGPESKIFYDGKPKKKLKDPSPQEIEVARSFFVTNVIPNIINDPPPGFGIATELSPYPIWLQDGYEDFSDYINGWEWNPIWNDGNPNSLDYRTLRGMRPTRYVYELVIPVCKPDGVLIYNFYPSKRGV